MQKKDFTCIGMNHGAPVKPASREDWEKMRREPWLSEMCAKIEAGDAELKHRLPVWTPHCAEFKAGHRAIADALKPLNRLMLDFDEKGHTSDIMSQLRMKNEKLKMDGIEVLMIEESVRRGTHVLVELPEGMTAEEAQQLMKEATGFEPDAAVKDVSRCIYMVPEDHTKYVSEKLFSPSPSNQNTQNKQSTPKTPSTQASFRSIPYSSIIRDYWLRNGGEPHEGERNVKLHKLASNLRSICDNKKDVLLAVMPRFGLSEAEMRSIIDSACKEPPKGISKAMESIIKSEELKMKDGDSDLNSESAGLVVLPPLKKFPIGLKETLSGVPTNMQMPVLCAVMPLAAAYADGVNVEYCDGNIHRLGLMSIIRGEQASNKSVCKIAIDVWKRQFEEEDALARKCEEEWKERKKGRKANEKAPDDPKVLIRTLPVTVSCSTLLKRLKYANGHTLYSFSEEIDTLRKTNGAGSWSAKYDVYRLSFDNGEWGQDYNSDQAESGVVNVSYNWTMLGTNGTVRKCFKGDNIENGLSSRVLVASMPDGSFTKLIKFSRRSAEEEERIQEAVRILRNASGEIKVSRLRKAIEKWLEEKRVEAAKDIDHVKDIYRRRAAVIGFRCGVVFHLLTGKTKESKTCIEFAQMMAEYCLNEQMRLFGEALHNQYINAQEEGPRQGANHTVFDQLPPTFTKDDLRALKQECTESGLRNVIMRWKRDGWIQPLDRNRWQKCPTVPRPTSH
jgi:hypothetical protein